MTIVLTALTRVPTVNGIVTRAKSDQIISNNNFGLHNSVTVLRIHLTCAWSRNTTPPLHFRQIKKITI